MAIVKANNLDFSNKKVSILIYGVPSIGKTTLGLSAPKPLLLDLDKGVSRVEVQYRTDTALVKTFDELKQDLTSTNLTNYETIVVDTGGNLLELLKPYVIKQDSKNAQRSGNLSLSGYGAIAREFKDFTDYIKSLDKHIVFIFHAVEDRDGDEITYRLSAEGSTRTRIWESIDLGGFMEVTGKERTINFSANSRSFAKGNHEINGNYRVPLLKDNQPNTFLTDLINSYLEKLNESTQRLNEEQEIYNRAMAFKEVINAITNVKSANTTFEAFKKVKFALTAKQELWSHFVNKTKELGLTFNREKDAFELENKE